MMVSDILYLNDRMQQLELHVQQLENKFNDFEKDLYEPQNQEEDEQENQEITPKVRD